MRALLAVFLAALLLPACGSVDDLVGGGGSPGPLVKGGQAEADNSVRLTVAPGTQTTAWFLFSASSPEGGRVRVKFTDPTGWIPTMEERVLAEIETLQDGTFPKAASLPVDEDLSVRLIVDYQDPGGRWQRMSLLYPVTDAQWETLMPAGRAESDMIRWAVHGDPMNGSFGVKIRLDR